MQPTLLLLFQASSPHNMHIVPLCVRECRKKKEEKAFFPFLHPSFLLTQCPAAGGGGGGTNKKPVSRAGEMFPPSFPHSAAGANLPFVAMSGQIGGEEEGGRTKKTEGEKAG